MQRRASTKREIAASILSLSKTSSDNTGEMAEVVEMVKRHCSELVRKAREENPWLPEWDKQHAADSITTARHPSTGTRNPTFWWMVLPSVERTNK